MTDGKAYAALEARSMIAGGCAFFVYAWFCMHLMAKQGARAKPATIAGFVRLARLRARRMDLFSEISSHEN